MGEYPTLVFLLSKMVIPNSLLINDSISKTEDLLQYREVYLYSEFKL